jgi:hypothetical protein
MRENAMASRKSSARGDQPQHVRKSLMVDAAKLEKARQLLRASSDAEVLRIALDRLLDRLTRPSFEEE